MKTRQEIIDFLSNPNKDSFNEIAEHLIHGFEIRKKEQRYGEDNIVDVTYTFAEIEFYYYGSDQKDRHTYIRRTNAGQWFFHDYGVDIAFKTILSEDRRQLLSFGGILIRTLIKHEQGKDYEYICGPIRCQKELLNNNADVLQWDKKHETNEKILSSPRVGLGTFKDKVGEIDPVPHYRFYIEGLPKELKYDDYSYIVRQKDGEKFLESVSLVHKKATYKPIDN